ncbi:MAG: PAS domain S-box protein [Pirellulales bacterium]
MSQYRTLGLIVAGVTLCLALASIILSIRAANRLYLSAKDSEQSLKQYDTASDLLVDILDMETGVRGYAITDDPAYLAPYQDASKKIVMHLNLLTLHEDGQLFQDLEASVVNARAYFDQVVAAQRAADSATSRELLGKVQGKVNVDRVRDLVGRVQVQERRRYAQLVDETNMSFSNAIVTAIASGFCVISFILFYLALTKHFNSSLVKQTAIAITSEKNYRTLVHNAPIGIAQIGLDGKVTEANKLMCDTLQTTREQVVNSSIFDFVSGEDREVFRQKFSDLSFGCEESLTWQHKIIDSRGNGIWILNALSLLRDDNGRPNCIVAAMVDESDRYEAEVVRKQMEAIVNCSNDAVISKSFDGVITSWNPTAERLFGFTKDEIVGQTVFQMIPEDHHESEVTILSRCAASEFPEPMYTTRLHKDGHRIDVLLNVMPLFDTNGESLGICSIIRDLTGEKKAAASLLDSEKRFQMLADNMSQFAWMANPEGWIYWYNKRWYDYTGTTLPEMQGWGWTKVHHPDHLDRVVEHLNKCWETGAPWEDTFPLRAKDGSYRWFLSRALPIRDLDGRITNWFGSNTDITELIENEESLKKARQQAEDASKARGEFLANMSHEIRTPMTAILGHSDILAEHSVDPDNIQSVETIRRSSKYLLQIINDILDLSKIDSGKFKTELIEFSPSMLLHELWSLLDVRAAEKRLVFEVSISGKIPKTIVSDPIRLRQILMNLAGNAIKFTEHGTVTLICSFANETGLLSFAVSDTGIGIPEEFLENVFQPFVQADTSSTRAFEGTGLGLAISQRLAHALGGDISVSSKLGVGSTFILTIACATSNDLEWVDKLEQPIEQPATEKLQAIAGTILVVDDRRDIRLLVQTFLEKAGARVLLANNGQEAIDLMNERQPIGEGIAGVVMDMQMPIMDGYTAARELRRLGFSGPIVALTANAMKEDREKCLSCGCDDYATKPLDGAALVHVVASNLSKKF